MGDVGLKRKIWIWGVTVILLCLGFLVSALILFSTLDLSKEKLNESRLTYSQMIAAIEVGDEAAMDAYEACLVMNDGTVMRSTLSEYVVGDKIDLHRFSSIDQEGFLKGSSYFISPIVKNQSQQGTLIIKNSENAMTFLGRYGIYAFLPIAGFFFAILILVVRGIFFIQRDMIYPVMELKKVTQRMLNHDYGISMTYDYTGEIGELCHDFETMRDELNYFTKQEEKYKKNEKELLACISHDLKTPLAIISGYVEGIRNEVVTEKKQVNHYLDVIIKKIRFISKLIDDILEQSKAELHELSIMPEEVYANELLGEICLDLSLDVIKNGFIFTYSEIPHVLVMADRIRISQVLQNIVSNSIKYSQEGGKISITFSVCGQELVIAVSDNGQGIAVSDIAFIFDKFYRGEKARTMNTAGSGLGLNISKYIVEAHGGRIECDSLKNEGTTIRFSILLC